MTRMQRCSKVTPGLSTYRQTIPNIRIFLSEGKVSLVREEALHSDKWSSRSDVGNLGVPLAHDPAICSAPEAPQLGHHQLRPMSSAMRSSSWSAPQLPAG